tara:strand:- start:12741 stop:13601 length:861 start_codon:yes stop_codon:yes gene_type:complete
MFIKGHCSPRKNSETFSCLSKKSLKDIAKVLNKEYDLSIKLNQSRKKLFTEIKSVLSKKSSCLTESCWSKLDFIINNLSSKELKILNDSFRPFQPKEWRNKPKTWLNTTNIDDVMSQYEKKYIDFKYFGATPINFDLEESGSCLVSDLCKFNLNDIKNENKKCVGFVFNTDPHDKPGQHWFSMFIDIVGRNQKKPAIYYFDSAEAINDVSMIPKQILEFIEDIQKQNNYQFKFLYNDIQHQYKDTECGVYCLHFLTEMLKGKPFKKYINQKTSDKKMNSFRKKFFI